MITSETIIKELTFEDIEPYLRSTGEGDTGLTSRLKLKRNFEKIRAVIVEICEEGIGGGTSTQIQVEGGVMYSQWERGRHYYAGTLNPDTGLMETSLVWHNGRLWCCLKTLTSEEPAFGCKDWKVIWGNTTFSAQIISTNGAKFHNGNVDTVLTVRVYWGDDDITDYLLEGHGFQAEWKRMTGYDSDAREFQQQPEDLTWKATVRAANTILLQRGDMGSGWMIAYRQTLIMVEVTADCIEGTVAKFYL